MKTVDQVANELFVSRGTVVNLIKKGTLRAIKVGDQYRIEDADFNQFKIDASSIQPNQMVAGSTDLSGRVNDNETNTQVDYSAMGKANIK